MRIRYWGVRGSIPTPGPETVRYGGNTSCIEVSSDAGTLLVLDCGTGARALGHALLAASAERGEQLVGSVLIGHTHWDHIQGLPFFTPLFDPTSRWALYGPRGLGRSLADTLAGQMQYQYFPLALEQLGADVAYHDLVEGELTIGDLTIHTQYLNHPALTLGYRIEGDGVTVVYASDHEPHDQELAAGGDLMANPDDARHVAFLEGADVVIHDTQYDAAEYARGKAGWGHSTMEYAVDAAALAGVGHLVLYHHDPLRDDARVDALLDEARRRAAGRQYSGTITAAAEGEVLTVTPREAPATSRPPAAISAMHAPAMEEVSAVVVLAVGDPVVAAAVRSAAVEEELPVRTAMRAAELADAVGAMGRAVVVVDIDDDAIVEQLQQGVDAAVAVRLAVVGLTRRQVPLRPVPYINEWRVWPATIAHVRTKLRAALLRRACRWQAAPAPLDEERRLRALRSLGLLDTPEEERFDRYTAEACETLGVPVALISLVDAERQWFKSHRGTDARETPRDMSVCAHAILGSDVMQIPDLLDDVRFADNPAITGADRPRFYCGVPLILADGSRVGTLCVVDHRPRLFDADQLDALRRLGALVQAELEASVTTAT